MIHVDLTPLQRIRADKEAIIRFYRLNSEHFSNPDELAEDTPLFYYDNSGEWTVNSDFQNQLRNTQRELSDSQAVKEAMLIVKVSEGYNPNQLANRVVECLQARLEHIHRLSVELIDAVPDCSGTYQMKAQIFKHFAVMCYITGCFTKGEYFARKHEIVTRFYNQRIEFENEQNK
tara:strand:- start:2429 stop:2953 length:525 start_codon:yes stop_codon:yes gene_type:complete